jgi:hypothetical protein
MPQYYVCPKCGRIADVEHVRTCAGGGGVDGLGHPRGGPRFSPLRSEVVMRRAIIMTTRSANKFERLCPELAGKLGWGVRTHGSEWTAWFPSSRKDEEEIIRKLRELGIPFRVEYCLGPKYVD